MKRLLLIAFAAALALSLPVLAEEAKKSAEHGTFKPSDIQWKEGPASLPPGAKLAVLEGNPQEEGLFTMRAWLPDGYRISPHWHAAFEHVTVISGTFRIGMGEKFDESKLQDLPAGGFGYMAPGMRHFAAAKGDTVVQIHAMGPWQLYYVNPADDPRSMKK